MSLIHSDIIIIFVYVVEILLPRFITRIQHLSTHQRLAFFWYCFCLYGIFIKSWTNETQSVFVLSVFRPSVRPSVTLWDKLSFKETIQHIVLWRHTKINIGWNKNSTFFLKLASSLTLNCLFHFGDNFIFKQVVRHFPFNFIQFFSWWIVCAICI